MPQTVYNSSFNTVNIIFLENLTAGSYDASQFNVANTNATLSVINAYSNGSAILTVELAGTPTGNFGIVYTPGADLVTTADGDIVGQNYFHVNIEGGQVCTTGCDDDGSDDIEPVRVILEHVICLDKDTIEIKFNRYVNRNFIPPLSAFTLLDVPVGGTGNFLQVSISGRSVLLEHDFSFPLSGTTLQYLPPTTNYIQTADTPPQLILPFEVPLVCGEATGLEPCDIQNINHKNGISVPYGTRVGEVATIQDYILIYGMQEAIQASNDDNGGATTINMARLQAELDHAAVMLENYIDVATWSGKALLAGSFKRTQLVITRYYLLNKTRPEVVKEEFSSVLSWIDQVSFTNGGKYNTDCLNLGGGSGGFNGYGDGYHSGGRVMTWGTTMQYDPDRGLGMRGWHLPTAGDENLWAIKNSYYLPDHQKRRTIRGGA